MKLKNPPKGLKRLWKLREKSKLPTDFYVFDTETAIRKGGYYHWNLEGEFIFGVIYGYNYCKVIHDKDELIQTLLESRFKGRKVFAHNLLFDIEVLFGNVYDLDPEAIFAGSRLISCTNGNCTFADSANIFVGRSIKQIGKMLGIEKPGLGDQEGKSKIIGPDEINRCIVDCQIDYEALFNMFCFAGDIKITQASLSLCYYRTYHQPFHIDYNDHVKEFWKSYYGGRCEVLVMGKTYASMIDQNSQYPYAMKKAKYPNPKTLKVEHNLTVDRFNEYLGWYEGNAVVDLYHPELWIGLLPVKHHNKLLFPTGNLSGCWNFNELRFAIKYGCVIKRVRKVTYGEPMESIFVSFVDELNLKKIVAENEGNMFERDRAKRFSNSLYGKFAQRIKDKSIYLRDYEKQWHVVQEHQKKNTFIKLLPFSMARKDAVLLVKPEKKRKLSHAIPSFPSYVTAYGRIMLAEKLMELKDKKPVYCDTDGIAFAIADNTIVSSKELGGWKVENKIITEVKGPKNYKYIDLDNDPHTVIWRVKGVPVNMGRTIIKFEKDGPHEYDAVTQISDNEFEYYNLMKSKEALRRGKPSRKITKRTKKIKGNYDKRYVLENGETKPFTI